MSRVAATGDGLRASLPELVALRARGAELGTPRRRSGERSAGPVVSAFRGRGMEYAESRPYAPGDDVRHIDWRVTARTGRAHSKVFQTERDRVTLLVVDRSVPMQFGTRVRLKSVQAARLGATLAWAAFAQGDRIGACSGAERVPPARGRAGVLRTLEALARWSGAGDDAQGLAGALETAARVLHPGSHLLLLADARSVTAALEPSLRQIAAHNDVVLALVCDALERGAPPRGRYHAADAAHRVALSLPGERERDAWQLHFQALHDQAIARARRCGARAAVVAADADPVVALRAVLEHRVAGGRAA